jgi:hypothetical protein
VNLCHYPDDEDEHDPDALAEAAAARVGLDGAAVRDPLVFICALVPRIQVIHRGDVGGCFDPDTCILRIDPMGKPAHVRTKLIHELGHVIHWVNGIDAPHDEAFCDRVGQAGVVGRGPLVHCLARLHIDQVVAEYKGAMSPGELLLRVGEVWRQEQRMRRVG